jgi:hypothetical protein
VSAQEQAIRSSIAIMIQAISAKNEEAALNAGLMLATQVLVDLNRIAGALERMAAKGGS